ncbi:GGDEF domain-containing protein [Mesoaciditoga sp.]
MKFKMLVIVLVAVATVGAIFSVLNDMKRYDDFMLSKAKISSKNTFWYFKDVLSTLSNTKMVEFPSATVTTIKGYALFDLEGHLLYGYNALSNSFSKNSNAYKYATLEGKYVSPFFKPSTIPFIMLACKTSDRTHISMAIIGVKRSEIPNTFLVDKTGLGVNMSNFKCENFLSVMGLNKSGIILKNGELFFVEPVGIGGYSLLIKRAFWSTLFEVSRKTLYIWLLIFLILLSLMTLSYYRISKKVAPVLDFEKFLKGLDTFKKYEKGSKSELSFKYNQLVEKHEKLDKDYSELIKNMNETNAELVEMNKLLIEFSMLFNEVKTERKSLQEALRMAFRRILDFSKPISGIGMKYKDMEIYLGTVNNFNFDSSSSSKINMDLKTDSTAVKYVVNVDRFTINERTKEMIRTLLYHVTTFLSMYEFLERSKNSMKYDPLTGLSTRQEFEELMVREEALAKRENKHLSFFMMDVKKMREFNEKYGKFNGDVLLKYIARVISENIRLTDIAARYGEDEFVVCFYSMKKEDCLKKANLIISQLKNYKYEVNVKYAVLTYPSDGESVLKLISTLERSLKENEESESE